MAFFTAASKADFQHQLQAALAQHISEQALPQVALFAEQFFGIISLDELTHVASPTSLAVLFLRGACLSASITRNRKCASTTLITNATAGSRPTPPLKSCTTTCRFWSTRSAPN
jgi:hypothetical protein